MKKYFLKLKKHLIIGPLFKFLEAAMEVTLPFLMALVIEKGLSGDLRGGVHYGLVMLAFILLGYVFAVICQQTAARAQSKLGEDLRRDLLLKMTKMSKKGLDKFRESRLLTTSTQDVYEVMMALAIFIRIATRTPFIALGSLIMLFFLNVKVALIFLASLPILALIFWTITKKLMPKYGESMKSLDGISKKASNIKEGILDIHSFNLEEKMQEKFEEKTTEYEGIQKFLLKVSSLMNPISVVFINLVIVVILNFSKGLVGSGEIPLSYVSAFITYMLQLSLAVAVLVTMANTFYKGSVSSKRIMEVLDYEDEEMKDEANFSGNQALADDEQLVEFKNVSTTLGSFKLEEITFNLMKGETLGILGVTASGKTTLANLILKNLQRTSGEITLFGQSIDNLSQKQVRENIRICPQNLAIFKGSLKFNLTLGENVEETYLEEVVENICPFVKEKGYGFLVEEEGLNLSGGQKQRISIARSILANPKILIVDDSLSALDFETELKVRRYLEKRFESLIIVSQRISTIEKCNKIAILDNGKMAVGTKSEMEKHPLYNEISASQRGN